MTEANVEIDMEKLNKARGILGRLPLTPVPRIGCGGGAVSGRR
jgi:hypothetical protein